MSALEKNAAQCTGDLVEALESLIQEDANLATIYANSAIAAAMILYRRYGVPVDVAKPLFEECWAPMVSPMIEEDKN